MSRFEETLFSTSGGDSSPFQESRAAGANLNSRDLRRLESDYPGLQTDERVRRIFTEEEFDAGKVVVVCLDPIGRENGVYLLGGEIDYRLTTQKVGDVDIDKTASAVSREYYHLVGQPERIA